MRSVSLVVLIAGCGFTGSPMVGDDTGSGTPDPGGGSGSSSGSGSGTGTTGSTGSCDVTGATLRLCVSFGQNPVDLLDPPHALVDATGIRPITGILNTIAGAFDTSSHLRFAESQDFDVQDLTLDVWMSADARPGGGKHEWIADNNMQYFASYEDDGSVRCGIGNTAVTSKTVVPTKSWHHVACTYAAQGQELRVYVDGDLAGCVDANPIPQGGHDGLAIGANYGAGGYRENFVGQLDMLHLRASALPASDICSAANRSGCNSQCPD
jgi:hypothetical protein